MVIIVFGHDSREFHMIKDGNYSASFANFTPLGRVIRELVFRVWAT